MKGSCKAYEKHEFVLYNLLTFWILFLKKFIFSQGEKLTKVGSVKTINLTHIGNRISISSVSPCIGFSGHCAILLIRFKNLIGYIWGQRKLTWWPLKLDGKGLQ
jgi:hypothetical protein